MGVAAETLPKHPHEPRHLVERVADKIRADAHERIILGKKKQTTLCEALERFIQSNSGTPTREDYLAYAYMGDPPPEELPEEIQDALTKLPE